MKQVLKVLLVEDSEDDALLVLLTLRRAGYNPVSERVDTAADMRDALARQPWDMVLSDYSMPHFSGADALRILQESGLDLPFIIISGAIGEERAVEIMKAGAHDYVMKDNLTRLIPAIQRELRDAEDRRARRKAEEQVKMLSSALEQSASLVMITDTNALITYANPTFCHVTGYTLDELIGLPASVFRSEETPIEVHKNMWGALLSGIPWHGELLNKKKNGEKYWAEVRISVVRNQSGDVIQFLSVQEDITERKRLEAELQRYTSQLETMVEERTAELRRAKEHIEVIVKNTSDAIALAQSNGDIQIANPAFESMFDQQARRFIEQILVGIDDPNLVASLAEALLVVIYSGENRRVEARITSPDGQEKDIDMALIPVPTADDHRSGIVMSARDITHLKELERFKARFIADAVHDLSTPITALSTRIYLLKQSPEKLNEHVASLENQVSHLRDLLADLRMLSLLDRGQVALNLERANVNDLVRRVLDTYEPVAVSKEQAITFAADPYMPTAYFDRRQCERVISNLISNAINYTPPGKSIHILTAAEGNAVLIEIADQGIGIAPADLAHVFERFYRSAQAREIQSTGTGLGLAIVKEIVELHGGSVSVTSELGTGSTFSVRLPCR